MLDFQPPMLSRPGEITITPWSQQSIGVELAGAAIVASSQNFVTANLAVFIPFGVPEPVTVRSLWWSNGAAVAGNLDAGVYDTAGTRLVSTGTTGQLNTSVVQVVDVTDTTLARGVYYLALASDTSGATQKVLSAVPAAGIMQSFGLLQMAAAFVLPASATFAIYTSAFVPMVGLLGYRAVGP